MTEKLSNLALQIVPLKLELNRWERIKEFGFLNSTQKGI